MRLSTNSSGLVRILHQIKAIQKKKFSVCKRFTGGDYCQNNYRATCLRRTPISKFVSRHIDVLSNSTQSRHLYSTLFVSNRHYSQNNSVLTLRNDTFRKYLNQLEQERSELDKQVSFGAKLGQEKYKRLLLLKKVVEIYDELKVKYEELDEISQMLNEEEMKSEAELEQQNCLTEIDDLEANLVDLICPIETVDECDVILEVESGAGGQEAMLFSEEVFHMYENYALYKGWQFNPTEITRHDTKSGYRKAAATVSGHNVYGLLKYEGGVHRVQRVPKTEKGGRIHTSTISVAVFPQPTEIEVTLNPKDLKIEAFRSSGPGGQNANVSDTAVRIRHIPTGAMAEIQTTRSQHKNIELAKAVIRTKIYAMRLAEQRKQITGQRKTQVGNKDRADKLRTYNYLQDRITDHRLGQTVYSIATFLNGGDRLDDMIHDLVDQSNKENLVYLLEELEYTSMKERKRK